MGVNGGGGGRKGGRGVPGTSGSPKTHFSEQPRFLDTLDDHENERISFPALFCSNLNNESGILSAAGGVKTQHTRLISVHAGAEKHTPEGETSDRYMRAKITAAIKSNGGKK